MFLELISIIVAFFFLLYYSGIGFTRLVIPEKFKGYELLVIPFIGLFVVLFFAHIFGFIGIGSRIFTWIILAIATPLNFYAIKKNGLPRLNPSETIPVFIIASVVFLIGILPLFNEGYLTTIGTNGDAALYTMLADHFLTNGLEPPKNKGIWFTNLITLLMGPMSSRVGPMYFQSMIGAITGLEGYKTFSVIINLFHALLIYSAYLFIMGTGLLSRIGSLFAITILGINSLLYWGAINGYFAQIMMAATLPLSIAASFHMLTSKGYKNLIFSVAICSGILMTAPESLILVIGPLSLFGVIKILKRELLPAEAAKTVALWGLLLAIINILPMSASLEWLYNLFGTGLEKGFQQANPGDVGYFIPLTQIFGFTPPYHPLYREIVSNPYFATASYLTYFYSSYAVVLVFFLLSVYTLFASGEYKRTVLISIFAPYFLMELYFRFTFPYGYFKVTSSTLFITVTLITISIWSLLSSRPAIIKAFTAVVATLVVSLSLASTYMLFDMVVNSDNEEWITINKELIALREYPYMKKSEPLLIEDRLGRGNKYYWINYLLQDREVFTRKALPGTESFRDKELKFGFVIDGGYRYQEYLADGWTPIITTSRYIVLEKGKKQD